MNAPNNATGRAAAMPEAKVCMYLLNKETGRYDAKVLPVNFTKLPPELKVEPTQKPEQIQFAENIIRSRVKNGKHELFTGLRKTSFPGWFYGDHVNFKGAQKIRSFLLFNFSPCNTRLTIYFFNAYNVYPQRRNMFIAQFMASTANNTYQH